MACQLTKQKCVMTRKSQTFSHLALLKLSHKALNHMTATLPIFSFSGMVCSMHLSPTLMPFTLFFTKNVQGATQAISYFGLTLAKDYYLSFVLQIQSIFPCVCSVVDQRWSVGKKKWYTGCSRVRHRYSCHVCFSLNFVSLFMVSISRHGPMIELGTTQIKKNWNICVTHMISYKLNLLTHSN